MKKIKTIFFWRNFFGFAVGFLVFRFVLDLLTDKQTFEPKRIASILVTALIFGIIMGFYTKPKPKRITNFHEVE